ncbi:MULTISPECIES: hypothetical protein [unclassified Acinetobacter]|uniref:LPD3 domain-containing protein n=1 Tax=unclassified Acinetobacter TaxID=196816 RepID=UPI00244AC631|nr:MULTISPECIES: hypothetical protein [unclassified Acinetobacter]MDH0032917.1 hypothetical protein [Acinetobacter sp. GD04021]MDH0887312.1 hypothetical protein [Acinetobacter sp. GD03873]MDH1084708.1 hypothetical protein [Acinetobacter sp. GD03983]MDH2190628.1 hypothetical protein [Acinetobacter sp. GD03645]MDH2205078.1 hypothetical protein [Acinetobacter sp. GD03647]
MSKVKNVTNETEALTALDEMSNLITEFQKKNFKFLSGPPIASIKSGQIKPDAEGKIIKNAMQWLRDWLAANNQGQEFQNEQLGTVIIAPSGIKSAMSHKPKQIDIQGLPALPLIIEKARVLNRSMDDEGKPIENIVVAAPINLDDEKCYMVVRLRRHTEDKNDKPRFYTQAVTIAKDIKKGNIPSDQVAGQNNLLTQNGGRSRLLNVLHDALNVNIEQKSKKIKVYGWKAVEMARNLTFEQLEILTLKAQKEHFIPQEQRTNIYVYDQAGRKKLDVLSWAVHHKLEEFNKNPNENDKPLDHEDVLRIRTEFQADYEQGAFDSVDGFDSIDADGQWVLDKIDSMIVALQNLHGSENKVLKGRSNNVKTAKGTKVSTVFAVLDADKIIASHTATGAENPNYPQELQPRDRSRESSQAWVQKTSNTLDPESLGRSGRADTGAPIVGDDLVVESGNGRTMAIQLAYERGNANEYKQWLIDEAEYFGFDPEKIKHFEKPILVRIRTSEIDRIQFTVEANQDDKLSFSATERAKSDARRLDENLLSLFMPGDDGDLLTVGNQKFVQGFLKSLGETEAAQYITTDGKPTQALVTRIKAAIFSKAYNDDRLLEMMADQTKPDLQNMLNALGAAAPKFIEAQSVSRGNVQDVSSSIVDGIEQALDKRVANAIIDAANTILAAKQNDQDIAEFVKQQGLFGDLAEGVPELAIFLSKNSRSAKKMSLLFKAMAEFAEKQALDQQNIGLFGDPEPVSIKDAIDYAVKIIEENYGENTNLSMFDSVLQDYSVIEKRYFIGHLLCKSGWKKKDSDKNTYIKEHINGARKLLFNMNENQNDFSIEIAESDGGFVAEIGGCKDKKISEIFEYINGFLLDEQQIDPKIISDYDNADENSSNADSWMNGQIIRWFDEPDKNYLHSLELPAEHQIGDKVFISITDTDENSSMFKFDAFIADIKFKLNKVWYGLALRISNTNFATLIYLPSGTFEVQSNTGNDNDFTELDQKAHEAATSTLNDLELPSSEQKESGDYQKGHLAISDLNIAIENPAGSIRSGTDELGNEWKIRMQHHYGFLENTTGADGDEIDVFVKNHLDHIPDNAYIIKQLDKDGKFDEHKVILGAETEDEAKEIYLSNYEQGWQGLGDIRKISMADLLQKIQHTWSEFDSVTDDFLNVLYQPC